MVSLALPTLLGILGTLGALGAGCSALTGQVRERDAAATVEEGATTHSDDTQPNGIEPEASQDQTAETRTDASCPDRDFVSAVGLPTGVVTIGEHVFHVEVAATRGSQHRGLMGRESLAPDAGMLFVFDEPRFQSFWMFNTPLALDIAFIREDLTISSIDTMEPLTVTTHVSDEPVLYVLEVAAGQFASRHIEAGDVVSITLPN